MQCAQNSAARCLSIILTRCRCSTGQHCYSLKSKGRCSVATAPAALQQYLDDPHLANRLGADFVRRIKAWFRCDTLLASITCDNPCKHMFHNLLPASCICKARSYAFFSALLCKQCHRVIHLCGHQRPFGLAECMHCIHTVHHLQKASLSAEVAAG